MKLLRLIPFLLLPFVFASCTDTREELDIKSDGSGTLAIRTDMSKMFEMLKSMGGEEKMEKEGFGKKYDTTILLKDYADTAKDVAPDMKAALRNGKVRVMMDAEANAFKMDMHFPYSSAAQLQTLYQSLNKTDKGLKNVFDNRNKKPGDIAEGETEIMAKKDNQMFTSVYDIVVTDHSYSRKVNKERYDAFLVGMKPEDLKQAAAMMGPMNYTIAVKLPRPVKKVSNSKAELSTDKQTVTLAAGLMDVFENAALLALEIEY